MAALLSSNAIVEWKFKSIYLAILIMREMVYDGICSEFKNVHEF